MTTLPLPKADILAPESLAQNSGTAEILRIPEVREAIHGDFLVLPCDLICELAGESLLEAWMIKQAGLGRLSSSIDSRGPHTSFDVEQSRQRGGLGVWFETKAEGSTKREETDFIITAPMNDAREPTPEGSLVPHIQRLIYSTTADTLKDIQEETQDFPLRHSVVAKHPRARVLTTYRDAHIYLFPHWVSQMVARNKLMESISEDVVGWWAKATWQVGLPEKLGLQEVFNPEVASKEPQQENTIEPRAVLEGMSTTRKGESNPQSQTGQSPNIDHANRKLSIPPFLAYVQPRDPQVPLIRRVDTAALLLFVSLRLAKLNSVEDVGRPEASPWSHICKIAYPDGVAQKTTINKSDCLIAENVTVESKAIIKESVVGANCHIKTGARLTRCLLMDGVVVGEGCHLTGSIIGRRARLGSKSILSDCEVQDGNVIPDETEAKNEKFMVFDGLDASDAEGEEEPEGGDILVE